MIDKMCLKNRGAIVSSAMCTNRTIIGIIVGESLKTPMVHQVHHRSIFLASSPKLRFVVYIT